MIETPNEQIIDQNHDHDHDYDHIISKKKKIYQIEKLENKFISTKWRFSFALSCFSLFYIFDLNIFYFVKMEASCLPSRCS